MKAPTLLMAVTVTALLASAGAMAQSPTPDPSTRPSEPAAQPAQDSQRGASFESLDQNKDGRISKAEATANKGVTEQFARYDQNGDGFIDRDEVNNSNNKQ
ncbi:MAG: EF-hand domain-containing protein [Pseudomonadota bacterium]